MGSCTRWESPYAAIGGFKNLGRVLAPTPNRVLGHVTDSQTRVNGIPASIPRLLQPVIAACNTLFLSLTLLQLQLPAVFLYSRFLSVGLNWSTKPLGKTLWKGPLLMATLYDVGTRAWQPDPAEGWVASLVERKQINGDKVTLVFQLDSGEVRKPLILWYYQRDC